MSKNLNFTYTVELAKFGQDISTNSTQNAGTLEMVSIVTNFIPAVILEMIRNKSVAFGACAFTITEENKQLINFTSPISTQTYTFLVSRPRELSRALLFMSPFTGDVSKIS